MGKFNQKPDVQKQLMEREDATVNYEGGLAFKPTDHQEFYSRVATWLVAEPKFYDKNSEDTEARIRELVANLAEKDPEFVLKMASYARNELYMRSGPAFLLALACRFEETRKLVPEYADSIVQRADEVTEVLAAYSALNKGKNVPRALRTGLDRALRKFDEYQLAKYNRKGNWTLRDAWRVIRPKPVDDEQRELWGRVVKGELKVPDTWEVALSTKGASKETWTDIAPKMGYMALLRNLRNFLKHGVDLDAIIDRLTDPEQVRRSKQFPYRFYSAYKANGGITGFENRGFGWGRTHYRGESYEELVGDLAERNRVLEAIETALRLSVDNVPRLKGRTFVACDNSGSMGASVSNKSDVTCMEIGNLMGALAGGFCEKAIVAAFGTDVVPVQFSKHKSVFDNMSALYEADNGGATFGWKIPQFLLDDNIDVDRVIIFTDMQLYDRSYGGHNPFFGLARPVPRTPMNVNSLAGGITQYRRKVGHDVWLYCIDLTGYGTIQTPEDDPHTFNLAGWSDRVFEWLQYAESDPSIVIEKIKEYHYERPERRNGGST
jgi:hypothetical protein